MTSFDIDLLQETLMIARRSSYFMPNDFKDFTTKDQRVQEVWEKLETLRTVAV